MRDPTLSQVLGVALLTGVSACGSRAPDPIEPFVCPKSVDELYMRVFPNVSGAEVPPPEAGTSIQCTGEGQQIELAVTTPRYVAHGPILRDQRGRITELTIGGETGTSHHRVAYQGDRIAAVAELSARPVKLYVYDYDAAGVVGTSHEWWVPTDDTAPFYFSGTRYEKGRVVESWNVSRGDAFRTRVTAWDDGGRPTERVPEATTPAEVTPPLPSEWLGLARP